MQLGQFHDYLYGRGLAPATIGEYSKMLRRANRWAVRHGLDLDRLTAVQVRAWADDDVRLSYSSRKTARATLGHYFRMVGRTDDPTTGIRVPAKPAGSPRPLTDDQARTLRDTAIMVGGRRGLAVLVGMYAAGRRSEIARIRWDGVDFTARTLSWWRSKRLDTHTVPLHPVLGQVLFDTMPSRAEGFIFAGNNGRDHVRPETVWGWIRQVGRLADIDVSPQRLRSTAGKMVLEATSDIDAAARLLGHSDLNVTKGFYTGLTSDRRLRKAVDALDGYDNHEDAPETT